jgi:hypothetical protein
MKTTDFYGISRCSECGAVGTIVDMGACCIVARMNAGESPDTATATESPLVEKE